MTKKRMLVTGGASLVGARLSTRLVAEGHEVIAVDDLSSGSYAHVRELQRDPRFVFVEHDVALPFRAEVDAIFHLAVPSSRRRCEVAPVETTLASVVGTARVFELAAERQARVVMATSPERWGEGVRCAESIAVDYVRSQRVDMRLVRVARPFGPTMPLDGDDLLTKLLLQAARGEPLDLDVRGDRAERLAWVEDAVEALVRAMRHELRIPPLVAPFHETTAADIARAVAEASGMATPTERTPGSGPTSLRFSMPPSARPTVPETLPASLVLGLEPALTLEAAIATTLGGVVARLGSATAPPRRVSATKRPARRAS